MTDEKKLKEIREDLDNVMTESYETSKKVDKLEKKLDEHIKGVNEH